MEQISLLEETTKEKITKQMKRATNKGIIPGAVVIFDDDYKNKYTVVNLTINDNTLQARLISNNCIMSYDALSERLTVVGFYK